MKYVADRGYTSSNNKRSPPTVVTLSAANTNRSASLREGSCGSSEDDPVEVRLPVLVRVPLFRPSQTRITHAREGAGLDAIESSAAIPRRPVMSGYYAAAIAAGSMKAPPRRTGGVGFRSSDDMKNLKRGSNHGGSDRTQSKRTNCTHF